jgi:hypothetical protein
MGKYIALVNGVRTEVAGQVSSVGVADAGKIVQLDATGRLDPSIMPSGIGADTAVIQASEALTAGDPVNVFDSAGAFRVRRADAATAGRHADGFVIAGVASGANATVYFEGRVTGLTGQLPGKKYLAVGGGYTNTPPVAPAANFLQEIGTAVSATEINFEKEDITVLSP